ncbi:efflux RND transporter permease subunit [Parapedomonas caeni]
MGGLVQFAVRRWQFTLLLFTLLAALGYNTLNTIPRSMDPHFPIPVVVVVAAMPGADPTDMEQLVSKPVEDVLQGLDDVKEIRSVSQDGSAVVTVEFGWDTDAERKFDEVVREVNAIRSTLPSRLQRLEFRKVRTTEAAVVQLALVSPDASYRRMDKIARDLRDLLNQVPGVRKTSIWGVPQTEVRVAVDLGRLAALKIPVTAIADALTAQGADLPAGAVHVGDRRFNVKAGGAFRTLEEVENTPVLSVAGRVVRVRDLATVSWSTEEATHLTRFNGKRAIFVTATQKNGVNLMDVRQGINEVLDDFAPSLPPDIKLERAFDQSRVVDERLAHLGRDFIIALALVLVTLLPLGVRASIVVMISIPLSLAIGLTALKGLGFTLNQLSIAGFVLSLGLLVDDSIVVTENIARHLREGASRREAALAATRQIAVAVVGCTATLMLAFLPLMFLPEGSGRFIRSLPLTVLLTVGASLIVSLTIIPFLASRILPRHESAHGNRLLQWLTTGIHRLYAPVLHLALEKPRRTLALAGALCGLAFALVPYLGFSMFPPADVPYFLIEVKSTDGAAMPASDRAVRFVEKVLAEESMVETVSSNIGRGNPQVFYNVRQQENRTQYGELFVTVKDWNNTDGPALVERLRHRFEGFPDADIVVKIFQNGPPIEAPIAVRISGPDMTVLKRLAGVAEQAIIATPGTRDISNPLRLDRTDLDLGIDEAKAAALGVPAGSIRRVTRLALAGEATSSYRDSDGDSYPVQVRLPMDERQPYSALNHIYVPLTDGSSIPLSLVAKPELRSAPAAIDRFKQKRTVTLTAYTRDGYLTSKVNKEVFERLQSLPLPAGYTLSAGGEAEAQTRSFSGLGDAILVAIFGILAVLVLEFGNFRESAVVAGVIPLGVFGGLIALALTGNSLSFTAVIGFIALIGIEIKNSILLVDFTSQLRREGLALREAIERAGEIRFLPVLLTSVTAVGGLLPLALSGSGLYAPLAWVIIGGLVSSTLLSRIVTPVMYLLLSQRSEQRRLAELED